MFTFIIIIYFLAAINTFILLDLIAFVSAYNLSVKDRIINASISLVWPLVPIGIICYGSFFKVKLTIQEIFKL